MELYQADFRHQLTVHSFHNDLLYTIHHLSSSVRALSSLLHPYGFSSQKLWTLTLRKAKDGKLNRY